MTIRPGQRFVYYRWDKAGGHLTCHPCTVVSGPHYRHRSQATYYEIAIDGITSTRFVGRPCLVDPYTHSRSALARFLATGGDPGVGHSAGD